MIGIPSPWHRRSSKGNAERGGVLASPATAVTAAYVVLAGAWIYLSTWVFSVLVPPDRLRQFETLKGWLFVAATGALLWGLLHGYWRARLVAQQRQAQSEAKLQSTLEDFGAAVLRFEAQEPYEIVSATEGVAALLGELPSGAAEGLGSALDLVHPEDRLGLFTAARASARDGRSFIMELRLLTRDSEVRWVWCKGRPVAGGDRVEVLLTDISRMKQLEARLLQAQRLEALSELAAGVAHDVNNFLTAVMGHAELAEQRVAASGAASLAVSEHLAEVKHGAQRASSLNQRLLRLGRPPEVERQVVDLNELVESTGALLQPMLRRRVHLVWEPDSRPVPVAGDPRQLEQVLVNLAVNARDAMPTGGRLTLKAAAIEVGAAPLDAAPDLPPGRYGCLSVADTGTGIPPEHLERLFEPFFTTKSPDTGTGLGLAMVSWLVEEHRGRIAVESTPGGGSTFRAFFPLLPESSQGPSASTEQGSSPVWSFRTRHRATGTATPSARSTPP